MMNFKFGDIVINHYASKDNPQRVGIVVSCNHKTLRCTNGRGDFWTIINDKESKTEKVCRLDLAVYNVHVMIEASTKE